MATAGTAVPSEKWPRRRMLLALLVVSGVLNLCFIAGAAWTRVQGPPIGPSLEQRYHRMAAELDLDPQQRVGFDRYVAAMRARTETMHQEVGGLIGTAWEEIAKPQADVTQVLRLSDEASEKRREFQHEAAAQTLAFLGTLSPAQRSRFVAIARERRPSWWRSRPAHR